MKARAGTNRFAYVDLITFGQKRTMRCLKFDSASGTIDAETSNGNKINNL